MQKSVIKSFAGETFSGLEERQRSDWLAVTDRASELLPLRRYAGRVSWDTFPPSVLGCGKGTPTVR